MGFIEKSYLKQARHFPYCPPIATSMGDRVAAEQEEFECGCGGKYASLLALSRHRRRYCRYVEEPAQTGTNPCGMCSREFNTFSGMRQHMRKAHPKEYNKEEEHKKKEEWGALEVGRMMQ